MNLYFQSKMVILFCVFIFYWDRVSLIQTRLALNLLAM